MNTRPSTTLKRRVACVLTGVLALTSACARTNAQETGAAAGAARVAPVARAIVIHETTGPIKTHAYLVYDKVSREAALIDVGGPIETLANAIEQRGLELKFILSTHGHSDHVCGIPAVRARFPRATWCITRAEYADMPHYAQWRSAMAPDEAAKLTAAMEKDPALAATMDFDFAQLGQPGLFIEGGQVLTLGALEIRALLCPGHSRGSVCYQVGEFLFSGDVLMYHRVGRTDLPGGGGPEAMQTSVRGLYAELADETTVHPGHGEFTEIGIEKLHNRVVPAIAAVP